MRDTDDLPVPTANCHLHHGCRDRKDEYEDMSIADAVKTLREYCDRFDEYCDGCMFHSVPYHSCNLQNMPLEWKVPDEADDISEDIQHVGYTPEACGYEK